MEQLKIIKGVQNNKEINEVIKQRLSEFDSFKDKPNEEWFSELCFCLLTANASAAGGMKVQQLISTNELLTLSQERLSVKLRAIGYRFPNVRSKYIVEARAHKNIKEIIGKMDDKEARQFLVENIKGLGMKEASHFLINVGRKDVAILDKHILRIIGKDVKSMNKKTYEEIEKELVVLSKATKTNLAELDLILWYKQTGKVLK